MSSTNYLDLKQTNKTTTHNGYQLEQYQNTKTGKYTLLLRKQRFGPIKAETTVQNLKDAETILNAAKNPEINMEKVLEK